MNDICLAARLETMHDATETGQPPGYEAQPKVYFQQGRRFMPADLVVLIDYDVF